MPQLPVDGGELQAGAHRAVALRLEEVGGPWAPHPNSKHAEALQAYRDAQADLRQRILRTRLKAEAAGEAVYPDR